MRRTFIPQKIYKIMLDTLQDKPIEDLVKGLPDKKRKIIWVPSDRSVEECLKLMAAENITTLAVLESEDISSKRSHKSLDDPEIKAIVNIYDILNFIVFQALSNPKDASQITDPDLIEKQSFKLKDPVKNVFDFSDMTRESSQVWTFEGSDPMSKMLDYFSKGIHRGLVKTSEFTVLISQSDVLRYITTLDEYQKDESFDASLEKLNLYPSKPYGQDKSEGTNLVSVNQKSIAIYGYRKMAIEGVSCLPVVNDAGELVATISGSDLRGMGPTTMKNLLLPCLEFLDKQSNYRKNIQLKIKPSGSLREAIVKILDGKVHHLWITDGATSNVKVRGVLAMTDIISKLSKFDYLK